jgi:hypothetical protein
MRSIIRCMCLLIIVTASCKQPFTGTNTFVPKAERLAEWPKDWSMYVGKTVIVDGWPRNSKMGPLLSNQTGSIQIADRPNWLEEIRAKSDKDPFLRVTGEVIVRDENRFLLQNISWTVLE